ncbi:MFS general substrate transporter [Gloeopeniophorella convolvens]|nr:MFS general substrate transporter [Gloeopeniophorella convolvens]
MRGAVGPVAPKMAASTSVTKLSALDPPLGQPVLSDTRSSYELSVLSSHVVERPVYSVDGPSEAVTPTTAASTADSIIPASSVAPPTSPTARQRLYRRLHFAALCWCLFLEGWNDGSTGPLLPTIQKHYHLGFAVVSLIFAVNTVGFIIGAFSLIPLNDRIGFGKIMVLGSLCQVVTYAMQAPAGPYPVMLVGYLIAGFGMALQNAGANAFVGSFKKDVSFYLGLCHASYGFGAFCAPFSATHFAHARHWSFHYLLSLGMAVLNTAMLSAVFRFRTQDEIMVEAGQEPNEAETAQQSKYGQILRLRIVNHLALFALIYVGVEVTLGGWIVTFIIRERQGGPNAGYISSGFFGGLTFGRLALIWLNHKIGEQRALFIYAVICIALEITVWVVPSLVENAIAVSLIGVLMGPMYPILVNYATKVLPKWLLAGGIGIITGLGQAGSAVLPLLTGVLASKFGISSLQPLVVAMMGCMTVVWAVVPKAQRRMD